MRSSLILLGAALFLSACSHAAPQSDALPFWTTTLSANHALVGKIWSPRNKAYVSPDAIVKHAAQTDFTLLGENHDNPDHHRLQGWVIRNVAKQNRKPAIVLEMIEETRQSALDAYQRRPDADAAGLGAAVNWDDSGWPAWADYQPIADAAFESGLPIVAGNPIKPGRGASSRLKMITDARRKALGADQPLASWRQERLLGTIDAGHCGLVPKQHLTPMIAIQRVRDAVLADNLNKAANQTSGSGAILIAGANHARNDFAVPLVLARLAPDATVLSLAFVEVDDSQTNPSDYAQSFNAKTVPFDYIWFTPRANDTDHCADLKEKFSSYKTKPHAKKIKNK